MQRGEAIDAPGKLYRLERNGSTSVLESGIAVDNSLYFSSSGEMLYFADSLVDVIWIYDYDDDTGAQ